MDADSVLSQKIRHYRKIRNMTQEKLADEIGFTTDYIASIESGRRKVSVENLSRFCKCFRVGVAELMPIEEQDNSGVRADWIAEINETLEALDTTQLGLVKSMVGALRR